MGDEQIKDKLEEGIIEQKNSPIKEVDIEEKQADEKKEDVVQEILSKLKGGPPQITREVFMALTRSGPMYPPFLDKINEEHISTGLGIMAKDANYTFYTNRSKRRYAMIYFIVVILVFIFLTVYIRANE